MEGLIAFLPFIFAIVLTYLAIGGVFGFKKSTREEGRQK